MQEWMEGYESDIEYTADYFREQDPGFLSLCALMHGAESVDVNQAFTYCELGCGQGITALIMAANYPQGRFYAVDFNPSHIARARRLAENAGLTNIIFLEKSFAQLVEDATLLPMCDFITMHGIFSWVNDKNRQYIVDILDRHLNSGGVVYNGYNVKPGWTVGEAFQKMLLMASKLVTGDSATRVDAALDMIKQFGETEPLFFKKYQSVLEAHLQRLPVGNSHYLVHEYLIEGWRAFYFNEVADYFSSAKLEYIGGASASDSYTSQLMDEKQKAFLAKITDLTTRELFKDFALNTSFRKDIFMRGTGSRLSLSEKLQALRQRKWMLMHTDISGINFEFKSSVGKVIGRPEIYLPLVKILAEEPSDLQTLLNKTGLSATDVLFALMFMHQANIIFPCSDNVDAGRAIRLNKVFCSQMFSAINTPYIALPVSRSAAPLKKIDMLFYRIILDIGMSEPDTLIRAAYRYLQAYGEKIKRDGVELNSDDAIMHLRELERQWRRNVLPTLIKFKAFG